jgi:hypothetical protein
MKKSEAKELLKQWYYENLDYSAEFFGDSDIVKRYTMYLNCPASSFPIEMRASFNSFWKKINTMRLALIWLYFNHNYSIEERVLLRLLITFHFIEETYED